MKALAVDIARNLETPIAQMQLPIRVETRTGDTPVSRRQRQRNIPPDILLTTPEQLALLLSSDDAPFLFASLQRIVLDELHALVTSKRGDLLSLGLARLWRSRRSFVRSACRRRWRSRNNSRASWCRSRRAKPVTLVADLAGALYWEDERLLVVSDLHLEKGSSYAMRGVLLPPYDTIATLGRLGAVIARFDPKTVIALGDSFHDRNAHQRLSPANREILTALQARAGLDLDCRQPRSRAAVRSRRRGRKRFVSGRTR